MNDVFIIHLSDLHICQNQLLNIQEIVNALIRDLKSFINQDKLSMCYVCFTGDLIQRGDNALQGEKQLDLAFEHFIFPLLEIGLGSENFIIIPGNHEIDQSKIEPYAEAGLCKELNSSEKVNSFLSSLTKGHYLTHIERIQYFLDFQKYLNDNFVWQHPLSQAYIMKNQDLEIGFACLNSAWRSTGVGENEKDKLIIGEFQLHAALKHLHNCDLKIALMHHPTNWLSDFDKKAVDRLLNQFDIVLNGHLHDLNEQQIITPYGSSLFCTCGALYNPNTYYQGYSIIQINPFTKQTTVYLRKYSQVRKDFVKAEELVENGFTVFNLNTSDDVRAISYKLKHGFENGLFANNLDDSLLPTILEDTAPAELEKLFVTPNLRSRSEYRKEESNSKEISIDDILNNNRNYLFIGKKETGKTTLLKYIALKSLRNFYSQQKTPFLVSLKSINISKNSIEKAILNFIISNSNNSLSKQEIVELLESGYCIILFDDLNLDNPRIISLVKEFIQTYSTNRFFITINEDLFRPFVEEEIPNFGINFEKVYINSLKRSHIRLLIKRWFGENYFRSEELLDKIMYYLAAAGMPRTFMVVSLLLTILHKDSDFVPINEANVMSRFMEILLEKLSPIEYEAKTYDFTNKEIYLSYLAWYMVENNKFNLQLDEFNRITRKYFESRGLDLRKSKFDKLFFVKKILVMDEDIVYFRYRSMFEYYVACKALKDPQALNFILHEKNYLNFINEISYLTAIERNRVDILSLVENRLLQDIVRFGNPLDYLENYELDNDIINLNFKKEHLQKLQLNEKEKDIIMDIPDPNLHFDTQIIDKDPLDYSDNLLFLYKIQLYGRVLRNTEDAPLDIKEKALKNYIVASCILLSQTKNIIEYRFTKENLNIILKDLDIERKVDEDTISILKYVLKVAMPISIQNFSSEIVGSGKLEQVIRAVSDSEQSEFSKFMLVFLYSDLRLPNHLNIIEEFVKTAKSKDIATLCFYKLLFYYQTSYFGFKASQRLEKLIANTAGKINKTQTKGDIINSLRKPELQAKRLLSDY